MTTIDRQTAFSGTREVAERLRFDVARLEDYLSAQVAGFGGPIVVSQFKGGQSNPTYLVETPLRRYVLRRKPPGKLLPSAHAVDREYRIISALAAQRFPVAEPVVYCADESIVGTPFFVMAHVEGRVFWEPQMPASNPAERAAVYDAMNATIARLHTFDPAAIGLADYGRGENYVARQVERWSKQYRASETQSIEDMERLIAWLPAHLPPGQPPRVVHGDYRLDNIILSPDAPQIAAVLDWELSTLGDPLADFTYHLMQWHMPPSDAGTGSLIGQDIAALGIPSLEAYVDAYVERTGLDPRPHLPVYFAYNFFRLAAILQGIAGRVRDGTATSAFAAAKADLVGPLAAKAWEFAPAGWRMKTFALALGGGGARGLAHIPVIEALDDLGLKPAAIAGTSIGALVGAAYAAGMRGKDIRRHVIALAHNRGEIMRRLIAARAGTLADLFTGAFGQATQLDAEKFCAQFLPEAVPQDFSALQIPLTVIATDLHRRQEAAFTSGPLQPALASSIAIPGLFRPVAIGSSILVDGGATNPLPFDQVRERADVTIAVDVFGMPDMERNDIPSAWESMFTTLQIMGSAIVAAKHKHAPADLVIRPNVAIFRTLDFYQASAILRTADAVKAEVKEKLDALLAG